MPTFPAPLRRAGQRLRGARRSFAQITIAVGGSWAIATLLLGYDTPFFAPIAAVIVLNNRAQRGRRAVEVLVGVAVGIAVADVIVLVIGTGGWQLVVVSVLAMVVVTASGGSTIVVTQAAVAAILVVTIQPPTVDLLPHRFFHALIGGATALLVTSLLPGAPDRQLVQAARPVIDALVRTLERVAEGLSRDDLRIGREALDLARGLDADVADLRRSVQIADETARMAPLRRGQRDLVGAYADAADQLDLAVRNTRVLARAAVALLQHTGTGDPDDDAPPELGEAVRDLADAVRALGDQLTADGPPDLTRRHAAAAAARTRVLYADTRALAISRVVGQIRSTGSTCSGARGSRSTTRSGPSTRRRRRGHGRTSRPGEPIAAAPTSADDRRSSGSARSDRHVRRRGWEADRLDHRTSRGHPRFHHRAASPRRDRVPGGRT